MIPLFDNKKILIVVKTYPTPSKRYKETVCTAGITSEGEWIRLYPIKFRYLNSSQQYKLFDWINISVQKSKTDKRPESYQPNIDSIQIFKFLDSKKNINERCNALLPLVKKSIEEINIEYANEFKSLAIFKPKIIEDFIAKKVSEDWTAEEVFKLSQISFFDNSNVRTLKKVPYEFSCKFICDDPLCKGHTLMIKEFEFNWSYFKYLEKYKDEKTAVEKLKDKWYSYFSDINNGYLLVGTIWPHPHFIIIGHFSYPKKYNTNTQISFLD
jgi:hypothetical protein